MQDQTGFIDQIAQAIPLAMYRIGADGRILYANRLMWRLLGHLDEKPQALVHFQDLCKHPDAWTQRQALMNANGVVLSSELEIRRHDGSTLWVEETAWPVLDAQGRTSCYAGILIDIGERKQTERTLQESEARYRHLLDKIPLKIFFKDRSSTYVTVNQTYARDFNLSPEAMAGLTDFDLFPADLAAKYRSDDVSILTSGFAEEFDEDYTRAGANRTVHTVKAPVLSETGEISGLLGIFWDITDRTLMEKALRESEYRYYGLFEHSPISLWEEDFSRVKQYIDRLKARGITDIAAHLLSHPIAVYECMALIDVVDVNRATLILYKARTKDELIDNFSKIFTHEAHPLFVKELDAIAKGLLQFESEGQNCTLAGEPLDIHLRWSVAPGYEDSLSKVFVSIADITARKRAEATIQRQTNQARTLVELSRALSEANLQTQSIYKIIVENTANLVGDGCVLTLLAEDRQHMVVAAVHHTNPSALVLMNQLSAASPMPVGTGALRQVVSTGQPLFLPSLDEQDLHRLVDPDYSGAPLHFGAGSLIVLPLIVQGQVIGLLGALRDHPVRPYSEEDLSYAQHIANQAALSIQNARLHDRIIQQAQTDALTGVHNRRSFFERAGQEYARAERYHHPLSIILLDLDHFKAVNDRFGHIVGDQVLCVVADRCQANIRATDIVGRIGGEEFAILLPETDLPGAARIAERLRVCIGGTPIVCGDAQVSLTASLGVGSRNGHVPGAVPGTLPPAQQGISLLLQKADEEMYAAKQAGRNQVSARGDYRLAELASASEMPSS